MRHNRFNSFNSIYTIQLHHYTTTLMKKILLLGLFILTAFLEVNATVYYNKAGSPHLPSNWGTNLDGTGTAPDFSNPNDIYTFRNGTSLTAIATWTINSTSKFRIRNGKTFNSGAFDHDITIDIDGNGVYNLGATTYDNLKFGSVDSTNVFNMSSGSSLLNLRTNLNYGSLTFRCNEGGVVVDLNDTDGDGILNIAGSLTINLANDDDGLSLAGDGGNYTINVGGAFTLTRGIINVNNSSAPVGLITLNITGNLVISSLGTLTACNGDGNTTINCASFNMAGIFYGIDGTGLGVPTISLLGDLNITNSPSYNAQFNGATSFPIINLNGSGRTISGSSLSDANHNITINGTISTASNFTVGGALTLTSGTFTISPGNTLTLEGTVSGSGAMAGSITSNITFQGTGAATLPAITLNTLTINRDASTVSLGGAVTVSTLNLNNGTLSIGANTLTVNSTISQTSGTLTGGSSSNLIFTTSLAGQNIPSATYNNLTLNNTGSNPFSVDAGGITVNGTLTLTRDELNNSTNGITFGNGANIIINRTGTNNAGAITVAPTFGTSVNVSYTGTGAITTGPELPSSASVLNNLTINNSAGVTLSAARTVNGALTLTTGTLSSSGNLTMNLNNGYIANTGTGAISGNITCTKTISRSGYTYLSVPVTGSPSLPTTGFFYYYNEPTHDRTSTGDAGWTAISPSALGTISSTNIGRGYSAYYEAGTTNISATGAYAHNTDFSSAIAISKTLGPGDTDTQNGWNLIGNPYPSVLDWDGVRADNSSKVDAQCHYYTGTGYTAYAGGVPLSGGNGFIPPMQGVYIKKTSLGSDVLDIRNNRRVNSTKSLLRKSSNVENVLEIQIENGTISDKTYIRLEDSASDGFDPKYDANKLNNTSSILPNINTIMKDIRLAINTISKDIIKGKMIPLKFTVPASGSFNLRFREDARINEGVKIYLHDKLLNVVQDIRLNPLYNVTAVKGDTTTRYFISFDGEINNINGITSNDYSISAHYDSGAINTYFKGINSNTADISLINTIGMEFYNKKSANITQGKYSFTPELNQAGIYILKVTTQGKTYTQRILVNQ